jgi:NADH-quinone oxidoreductase subunit J
MRREEADRLAEAGAPRTWAVVGSPAEAERLADALRKAGASVRIEGSGQWGGVEHVGWQLLTQWVFPFELVSLLIVVAILGAVVLAKKKLPPEL